MITNTEPSLGRREPGPWVLHVVLAIVSALPVAPTWAGEPTPSAETQQAEAVRLEAFFIDSGQQVQGEVLKEADDEVFVDLGFTIVAIPKKRIQKREVASAAAGPGAGTAAGPAESIYFVRTGKRGLIKQHAEANGDAVVRITTPSGLGSGFVIHAGEGYVVTNYHVIEREQKITVTFFLKKGNEYQKVSKEKVRIVAFNPFVDLALLKVEDMGDLKVPQLYLSAAADDMTAGDSVFAIGNPLGFERSISEGIVSKTDREIDGMLYIQTTAAINPGNSGGPLFDDKGDIVGITNMKVMMGEGLGFAIPVGVLKDFLRNRAAFAYDKDNPNAGYRYLAPPRRGAGGAGERKL